MGCAKSKPDIEDVPRESPKAIPPTQPSKTNSLAPISSQKYSEIFNKEPPMDTELEMPNTEENNENSKADTDSTTRDNKQEFAPFFKLGTHEIGKDSFCTTIIMSESDSLGRHIVASHLALPIQPLATEEEFETKCDSLSMPRTKALFPLYQNLNSAPRQAKHIARLETQFGVRVQVSDLLHASDLLPMERYLAVCGPTAELCEMAANNFVKQLPATVRTRVRTSGNMIGQSFQAGMSEPELQYWLKSEEEFRSYAHEYRMIAAGRTYDQIQRYRTVLNRGSGTCYTIQSNLEPTYMMMK